MNTISSNGQTMAMDGRTLNTSAVASQVKKSSVDLPKTSTLPSSSAEVAQNIANNLANVKEDVAQLQKLSDIAMGHKLQFNVNEDLGEVIIKVVDPKTNQTIREIPSADVQKMQMRISKVIGLIFDEMI
ncbi:MAG: flagellar protein FlaG [Treponema sp.]